MIRFRSVSCLPAPARSRGLVTQVRDQPELRVRTFANVDGLERALRTGDVYAGLLVLNDYDQRANAGQPTRLEIVGDRSQATFVAAQAALALVIDRQDQTLGVARTLAAERNAPIATVITDARKVASSTAVTTTRRTAEKRTSATGLSRSVAGMLVFWVFAISMGYATLLVGDRRQGVLMRSATTHASGTEIIAGEITGRFIISVVQAILIVGVSALVLGVRWGDPLGVLAVVVLFSMVSASVAVIVGCGLSVAREQVVWITDALMALLGVIGGCFFSLALLPDWVRDLGHISPHAWAVDAFERLVATNTGIEAIVPALLVLTGFAIVFFLFAVRLLRRSLAG